MAKLSPLKSGVYLKKSDLFFDSSKLLFAQVTDTFDFIWPTVAGMWNLRWQVNGYLAANSNVSVDELKAKFTKGSGGESANLRRACQEFLWDEQKEQFATFLLINSFAFYESWIMNTLKILGYKSKELRKLEKELQKRTIGLVTAPTGGVQLTINTLRTPVSLIMCDLFYDHYSSHKRNGVKILDNLMICYKCFKELRNCIMHRGSIADKLFIDAYNEYTLLKPSDLEVKELPIIDSQELDKPVKVNLRGIVGFYDIILKLVATIDAKLSVSEKAQYIVISKSRKMNGRPSLSPEAVRKSEQIKSIFRKMHIPHPLDILKAEFFLKSNSLVS